MPRLCVILVVLLVLIAGVPQAAAAATPQVSLEVVASSWKYVSGSSSDYVEVRAEIRNTSDQYVKDVAVRVTLLRITGGEITSATGEPMKVTLAPGESTFYWDDIYHDSAFLTADVRITPFGEPATATDYLYLPDPTPAYLSSFVDGGWVTYFGEIVNSSGQTWRAACTYCTAPRLIGVYYEGTKIVAWSGSGEPEGHRAPGDKQAFRFQFQRVPGGTFKLFMSTLPMRPGDYPTRWGIVGLQWSLVDGLFGKEIRIKATVVNLSDVAARPSIWIVARNGAGKWLGWTYCSAWSELGPGVFLPCDEDISSGNMHMGEPEDVRSVEVLVGSSAVSHTEPPTVTPTPSLTPTATATPTTTPTPSATPTATTTWTATATPTASLTPSATPVFDNALYLPLLMR